jgi:hypothetical protein
MTASTPCDSSQRASSTVVAEETMRRPVARTRASSAGAGRPKWKLTTAGRTASTTAALSASNGCLPGPGTMADASMPCSA